MEARTEKTLVVETGILCNNRCVFCYENGYRRIPGLEKLIDGAVVRERIEWGAANGFSELSLTGGEPTIRKDFIDLVRYARELGYSHVAVTTNGSRLCDPDFFRQAVSAGLDGMGVSIHGMSGDVHDAVTGRPGSFANAIRAIRNGARAAAALGERRFRLNTFTVLHQGNVDTLAAFTDMLAAIGVRLMVLQPPITGKSNVTPAALVPLDRIVGAIRAAAAAGARTGYRVKPFNVPPCLFRDVSAGLDLTMYGRAQFRENDAEKPTGHLIGREVGFVRFPVCADCATAAYCSGISVSLLPDSDILPAFDGVMEGGEGPVWLTGTELLSVDGIAHLLERSGGRHVWVCTGGTHRTGQGIFAAAAKPAQGTAGGRPSHGIALVHQARDPKSSDRILCGAGNGDWLMDAFARWIDSGCLLPLAVLGGCDGDFMDILHRMYDDRAECPAPEIRLAPPWRTPGGSPETLHEIVEWAVGRFGSSARVVIGVDAPNGDEALHIEALAARYGGVPAVSVDMAMHVPVTAFENRLLSVLNWSVPPGIRRRGAATEADLMVRSINVKPI